MIDVTISTEFITLSAFLKWAGACETGGEAKIEITKGHTAVNGEVCFMRGKKLYEGDLVSYNGREYRVTK